MADFFQHVLYDSRSDIIEKKECLLVLFLAHLQEVSVQTVNAVCQTTFPYQLEPRIPFHSDILGNFSNPYRYQDMHGLKNSIYTMCTTAGVEILSSIQRCITLVIAANARNDSSRKLSPPGKKAE